MVNWLMKNKYIDLVNYIEWLEYPPEEKLILMEDPISNKIRALEELDRQKILKAYGIENEGDISGY